MILIDKNTNLAKLVGITLLTETWSSGGGWNSPLLNTSNSYLIDAPIPRPWETDLWQWNGTQFTAIDNNKVIELQDKINNDAINKIKQEIIIATQNRLDTFAQTRNYDGILSACTYATDVIPKFAAEGQYCVEARGTTWAALYSLLAEVEAGTKPMPSSFADIEPLLPTLQWPQE